MSKLLTTASALFILASCAGPARRAPNASNATPTPSPTATPWPPPAPTPADKDAKAQKGSGQIEDYSYTYEAAGDRLAAEFAPTKLPRDQQVVLAVARSIIESVYGEKMEGFPRRVAWDYKDYKHAILLEGKAYDYVFTPVTDAQQKIPTLVFWRVARGSVG